ncbi:MAG: asparaginase [bacterium]
MPRVLILHTGGTLGMKGTPLEPDAFASRLQDAVPELAMIADIDTQIVSNLDSSDVGPELWSDLALRIADAHDDYDGFVVVHGTDTMSYTASALSFALENIGKPVILTGAQRPLAALRSDARRNLADAMELATRAVPEVAICFDGLLLRGCRTTKSSARDYRGFLSPDCPPLATLGVDVTFGAHIRKPQGPLRVDARFDNNVVLVPVTPGMQPDLLRGLFRLEGLKGAVVVAFGTGTVPTSVRPLAPVIAEGVDGGLDIVVITTSSGKVDFGLYKNSLPLERSGAIPGGEMRVEAAMTKLMHAVTAFDDRDERRAYLMRDVAGEMTT